MTSFLLRMTRVGIGALVSVTLASILSCGQATQPPAAAAPDTSDQAARRVFELKRACAEYGERFLKEDWKNVGSAGFIFDARYCYNRVRNTCIYSAGFRGKSSTTFSARDLLTNEELFSGGDFSDPKVTAMMSAADFRAREMDLFAQCVQ